MVIRPGVAGLKKTRLKHLPNLFEGRGEKGQCVNHVCVAPLISWDNGGYVDILFTCGECVARCNWKGLRSFTGRAKNVHIR